MTATRECQTCHRTTTRIVKGECQPCYKKSLRLTHQAAKLGLSSYPTTPARTQRYVAPVLPASAVSWGMLVTRFPEPTVITEPHCSQCGSTEGDDVYGGDQGYSACCNEPVASVSCSGCTHAQALS